MLRYVAPILCVSGTVCSLCAFNQNVVPGQILYPLGLVLAGIGYGGSKSLLVGALRESWSFLSLTNLVTIGFAIYSLMRALMLIPNQTVLSAIVALLPLSIMAVPIPQEAPQHPESPKNGEASISTSQVLLLQLLAIALISLSPGGLWGSFGPSTTLTADSFFDMVLGSLVFVALIALTEYYCKRMKGGLDYGVLYWVIITAVVLLPINEFTQNGIAPSISWAVGLLVNTASWISLADYAKGYDKRIFVVRDNVIMAVAELVAVIWLRWVSPELGTLRNTVLLVCVYLVATAIAALHLRNQRIATVDSPPRSITTGPSALDVAQQYALSPRETEVFDLLVEGKTVPQIQEALVISEGTAKTHMRNIYKKAGVHSRQELLALAYSQSYPAHKAEDSNSTE